MPSMLHRPAASTEASTVGASAATGQRRHGVAAAAAERRLSENRCGRPPCRRRCLQRRPSWGGPTPAPRPRGGGRGSPVAPPAPASARDPWGLPSRGGGVVGRPGARTAGINRHQSATALFLRGGRRLYGSAALARVGVEAGRSLERDCWSERAPRPLRCGEGTGRRLHSPSTAFARPGRSSRAAGTVGVRAQS